ncbi:hypothetical protein MPTK1_8g04870 [Marchantia polymorpha subsp. ruderalis]|uniref:Uncharacterized protein n=1 Tax=Marchantia polymorpha TaxID=3197 RepID=A0A2R6VZX1_MARPO|nr:hypothetical protein MARPO_0217s0012 [Marchantia polymorpha]BBN18717.1 hypothetical protein Mp_8g04870 [Marchantia polymorpha subsp. ruderalis]|eukprot:PTQ27153.1 hypothetical protein MARPO_0217s0012 [Marchantia polymorpha]
MLSDNSYPENVSPRHHTQEERKQAIVLIILVDMTALDLILLSPGLLHVWFLLRHIHLLDDSSKSFKVMRHWRS